MNHVLLARVARARLLRAAALVLALVVLALVFFTISPTAIEVVAAPSSDAELSNSSPTISYTTCFPYYRSDSVTNTGFQFINPSGSIATIVLVFYNADGTMSGSPIMDQIPAGGSKSFFGGALPLGQASAVISSDQPVIGFASVTDGAASRTLAYLQGCSAGETTLLVGPVFVGDALRSHQVLILRSRLSVQNLGASTANVTLTYLGISSHSASTSFSVPPYASHVADLSQFSLSVSDDLVGHVQLVSNQPIAAIVEDVESGQVIRVRDATITDSLTTPRFLTHVDDGAGARSTFVTVTSAVTGTRTLTSTFRAENGNVVDSRAQNFFAPGGVLVTGHNGVPPVSVYQGSGHASFRLGHLTQFDEDGPHGSALEFSAGSGTEVYVPGLRRSEEQYPVYAIRNDTATKANVVLHLYTMTGHEAVNLEIPGNGLYRRSALELPGTGHLLWSKVESDQPVSVWIDVLTPIESEEAVMEPTQPFTTTFAGGTGQSVSVAAPAGAVTATTTLSFEVTTGESTGNLKLGDFFFTLTALQQGAPLEGIHFSKPITVEITYSDDDVAGLDEDELQLAFYDEASESWSTDGITIVSRQPAQNRLSAAITHLTVFGLSDGTRFYYLPTVRGK